MNEKVYILSNPSMPGLYKIGKTKREVKRAIQELGAPESIPRPFEEEFSVEVKNANEVKRKAMAKLAVFRVSPNREFFRTDLETIKETIYDMIDEQQK